MGGEALSWHEDLPKKMLCLHEDLPPPRLEGSLFIPSPSATHTFTSFSIISAAASNYFELTFPIVTIVHLLSRYRAQVVQVIKSSSLLKLSHIFFLLNGVFIGYIDSHS